MDCFIKKIVENKVDEAVHLQFTKFSRGEFKDRASIVAKKVKDNFSISTSPEYSNELVISVAESLDDGETVEVTGAIISTRNLKEIPEFKDLLAHCEVKQFQGVKRFMVKTKMKKEQILRICEEVPKAVIALSFSSKKTELKTKDKAPKSGKPGKEEDKPKTDYCKIKTSDLKLVESLIFDYKDFKKIEINHDFIITNIEIPKDEKDPVLMRERAIREGKIVRKIDIDGKKEIREIPFKA